MQLIDKFVALFYYIFMIILGIDPGFAIIGYGVIEKLQNGKCLCIDYGSIETSQNESFPKRLQKISKAMRLLLERYKPNAVAIEELFFQNNTSTAIPVAEARGVIIATVMEYTENLFEYTPNQIKLSTTGTGSADKHQVQQMTRYILKLKTVPKPDDAADALAVALTHAQTNVFMAQSSMHNKLARGECKKGKIPKNSSNNQLKIRASSPCIVKKANK